MNDEPKCPECFSADGMCAHSREWVRILTSLWGETPLQTFYQISSDDRVVYVPCWLCNPDGNVYPDPTVDRVIYRRITWDEVRQWAQERANG